MRSVIVRIAMLFVTVELVYLGFVFYTRQSQNIPLLGKAPHMLAQSGRDEIHAFFAAIKDLHPSRGAGNVPPLIHSRGHIDKDFQKFGEENTPLTVDLIGQYLIVEDEWRATMREQHRKVVSELPSVPKYTGETGIVLTGGGSMFGQALVAIRYYRKYHPEYPIELWMAQNEYEPYYCKELFPGINVTCMVIEDYYGDKIENFDYMGYPLKGLAIAGSRFENIYFSDVDAFLLGSLDETIKAPAYQETGYISWPDYWVRITSPDYFDIIGSIDIHKVDRSKLITEIPGAVPYRMSSETGQVLINKQRHFDTLLLAAYYNLNGKEHYYPLLSQNKYVPGFGDKESFISAACALGNKVYQVNTTMLTLGNRMEDGTFHGSAISQMNPVQDYNYHVLGHTDQKVAPFSVHCTTMKLNPYTLFSEEHESTWNSPNKYRDPLRSLGPRDEVVESIGYDLELRLFEVVSEVVCEWALNHKPIHGANGEDAQRTCDRATAHVEWLRKH